MSFTNYIEEIGGDIREGCSVEVLLSKNETLWSIERTQQEIENYRRPPQGLVKKYITEIRPLVYFLSCYKEKYSRVEGALSSDFPDFVLIDKEGSRIKVEITEALALSKNAKLQSLNDEGCAQGYLLYQNNASMREVVSKAKNDEPIARSTDELVNHYYKGISEAISRKEPYAYNVLLVYCSEFNKDELSLSVMDMVLLLLKQEYGGAQEDRMIFLIGKNFIDIIK